MTSSGTPKICVVGACFIDLVSYVSKFPAPGETIHGKSFARGFGGKGANQAVAAARLRDGSETQASEVAMVGAVGGDPDGAAYLSTLKGYGVDTSSVATIKESFTGNAPIFVQDGGENMIVINPGATALVTPEFVASGSAGGASVTGADIVVCQNEIPLAATRAALAAAQGAGKLTVWSVAPVTDEAVAASAEMLKNVSVLIVNATEAAQMAVGVDSSFTSTDPAELARKLVSAGASAVVVTLGGDGAVYALKTDAAGDAGVTSGHVAAVSVPKEKVIDTTGAGDCFVGAFSHHLVGARRRVGGDVEASLREEELRCAIRFGCRAASVSVQRRGTQSSYPSATELPEE